MRKITFLATVLSLFLTVPAHADLPLRDYEWAKKDTNMNAYLVGFSRGVIYTNSLVGVGGQKRLFCMPRSFRLDAEVIFSVVDAHIKDVKAKENEFVEQLILDAFVKTYPCKN